ncbi:type IV collagenase, partial [Armadillidium nasatum]
KEFYVHDGVKLIEGTPKPISYYGISEEISAIDAVFFWPKNRKTYLFSRTFTGAEMTSQIQ